MSLDYEHCRKCRTKGLVIESRKNKRLGVRRRRHACPTCLRRWTSYQSLVNPRRALERYVRQHAAAHA